MARLPPRRAFASDRAMPPRSANWCFIAAVGRDSRLFAESITPRHQAIGYFGGLFFYGYQWWFGRTLSGDKEVTWIAGMGLGGQRLVMVPDLDLIMMTTSGAYGSPRQGNAALDILYRFVIPSVRTQ
jgi:hypothetical protein